MAASCAAADLSTERGIHPRQYGCAGPADAQPQLGFAQAKFPGGSTPANRQVILGEDFTRFQFADVRFSLSPYRYSASFKMQEAVTSALTRRCGAPRHGLLLYSSNSLVPCGMAALRTDLIIGCADWNVCNSVRTCHDPRIILLRPGRTSMDLAKRSAWNC